MSDLVREICEQWKLDYAGFERMAKVIARETLAGNGAAVSEPVTENTVEELQLGEAARAIGTLAVMCLVAQEIAGVWKSRADAARQILETGKLEPKMAAPFRLHISDQEDEDSDEEDE